MKRAILLLASSLIFALVVSLLPGRSQAQEYQMPEIQSGSDLLAAVNALRVSNGLAPYSAHPILMQIAQAQADYIAATGGSAGHIGPDGSRPRDRALAAGYSSVFFAENWHGGGGLSPAGVVFAWQGDFDHLNTMLSPSLIEAGGGVSKVGGTVYYVLDAGGGNGSPGAPVEPGTVGTVPPAGSPQPSQFMVPVTLNTPDSAGLTYHEVAYGHTLWSIAIAYGTKVNEIQALNGLAGLDIYPGQRLLIARGPTPLPVTPSPSVTGTAPSSPNPTAGLLITATISLPTLALPTSVTTSNEPAPAHFRLNLTAIAIIGGALLFAAIGTWIGMRRTL